jgi:hypothetical protein
VTLFTRTKIRNSANPDEVRNEPERGDDAAQAKALEEEHDPGEDQSPPEPAGQDAAPDHERACCDSKEAAGHVPDAVPTKGLRYSVQAMR